MTPQSKEYLLNMIIKTKDRFNTCSLAILSALLLFACGADGHQMVKGKLPPKYDKANTHMVKAMSYNNQWIRWHKSQSEQRMPTTEQWLEALGTLERAIEEAKLVSTDFMRRAHPKLPLMWEEFLIPSMEKIYFYYFNAVTKPESIKHPSSDEGKAQMKMLLDAHELDEAFADWYDQNMDAIRTGIKNLSE